MATPLEPINAQYINSMTQAQMDSLKDENSKIPSLANQIVMTDEEDANLSYIRTEIIYDADSSDSTKNWGYTDGIMGGVTVSEKDFSKYSKLIVYINGTTLAFPFEIDLTRKVDLYVFLEALDGYSYLGSGSAPTSDYPAQDMRSFCAVSDDKTKFYHFFIGYNSGTTFNERDNNDIYYVYKIEGVLKEPSMIYTGAELFAGNGITITDGVISGDFDSYAKIDRSNLTVNNQIAWRQLWWDGKGITLDHEGGVINSYTEKTFLWDGSVTSATTISLVDSMLNYKFLVFTGKNSGSELCSFIIATSIFKTTTSSLPYDMGNNTKDANRYCNLYYNGETSIKIKGISNMTLLYVEGIE